MRTDTKPVEVSACPEIAKHTKDDGYCETCGWDIRCHACGFEPEDPSELSPYDGCDTRGLGNLRMMLCHICAGTFVGSAVRYPRSYPDADTMKTIAYVGNLILAALKKR